VGEAQIALPALVVTGPREPAVSPDAEAARLAAGVILEADLGVVDVAELIAAIEGDEEIAVPER
jgi:hypothetical protein